MSKDLDAQRLEGLMGLYNDKIKLYPGWAQTSVHDKLSLIRMELVLNTIGCTKEELKDDEGSFHIMLTTAGSHRVVKISKAHLNTLVAFLYVNLLMIDEESQGNYAQLIKWPACPDYIRGVNLQGANDKLIEEINKQEEREARNGRVKDGIVTRFIRSDRLNPVAHVDQEKVSVVSHSDEAIVEAMLRLYQEQHRFALDPSPANWAVVKGVLRLLDTKFAIQVPKLEEDDGYLSDYSDKFIQASIQPASEEGYRNSDKLLVSGNYFKTARLRRLFVSLLTQKQQALSLRMIRSLHAMGDALFEYPTPSNASQYCIFSRGAKAILANQQVDVSPSKRSRRQEPPVGGARAKQLF